MMPRSDLRHNASVGLMHGNLRRNHAREQFPSAQDGDGRLVAGRFNRKKERAQFLGKKGMTGRKDGEPAFSFLPS
jgi:hypothetical protein